MPKLPFQPHCLLCRHYYITWEESFPYGCRVMEFKSRILPMQEVLRASGEPCRAFLPKEETAGARK